MKPILITHESYQDFVLTELQKHYSGGILSLVNEDCPIITKLWIADISFSLNDSYSLKGPLPRDPASMLRSYLLFLLTNSTIGTTKWADELSRVPLYAILNSFEPSDVSGVGTFYDFFDRLWGLNFDNVKPKDKRNRKKKKKKKPKKGKKQDLKNPGIVAKLVNHFFRDGTKKKVLSGDRLFEFFQSQILSVSSKLGLLGNRDSLSVAGDGTTLVTANFPRSKLSCDCYAQDVTSCD